MTLNRREFVQLAAAMGASLACGGSARASTTGWHERRDLYPEGVASGDPDPSSVILWTRRPFESGGRRVLTVEVAEDDAFRRVVAKASAPVSAESDWTTRVLVGHLKPARVYWYRFTDGEGNGSRVGRTITAPLANDPRPVNFAFVSCQSVSAVRKRGHSTRTRMVGALPSTGPLTFRCCVKDSVLSCTLKAYTSYAPAFITTGIFATIGRMVTRFPSTS